MRYPTREGMPISTRELELEPTRLPETEEHQSLHHLHWTAKTMGRLLISQTLRDLECEQEIMQNDQHNIGRAALHALYDPPSLATPRQMMDRLEYAKTHGFQLNVRQKGLGYVKRPFTNNLWQNIQKEYNEIRD